PDATFDVLLFKLLDTGFREGIDLVAIPDGVTYPGAVHTPHDNAVGVMNIKADANLFAFDAGQFRAEIDIFKQLYFAASRCAYFLRSEHFMQFRAGQVLNFFLLLLNNVITIGQRRPVLPVVTLRQAAVWTIIMPLYLALNLSDQLLHRRHLAHGDRKS